MSATNTTTTDGITVQMIEVKNPESSNIHSIGYDTATSRLFIRFRDGMRLYRYEKVSSTVWKDFQAAKNKNSFFLEEIKGYFDYEEIK